jgi:hypothetical protein
VESLKAGFPPFPHSLEIPAGFPHYHGYGDDYHLSEDRQSPPKTRNQSHSHRKGLVNHLPGLKRKGSPGTLTPERGLSSLFVRVSAPDLQGRRCGQERDRYETQLTRR